MTEKGIASVMLTRQKTRRRRGKRVGERLFIEGCSSTEPKKQKKLIFV
jgi:hypothetical protein